MQLIPERFTYRPFDYQFLNEAMKKQLSMFWLPEEVPMAEDVADMNGNVMTQEEKDIITMILRFFTQGDIRVAEYYLKDVIPALPVPEAQMCFSVFAAVEAIHVWSYAHLNDTLGLPEKEFSSFLEYEEMVSKLDILDSVSDREHPLVKLGVFSGFMEGVSLFSSFALLLNLSRFGMMKGVGQIVSWSVRDEFFHTETMCRLFRELVGKLSAEERYKIEARVIQRAEALVEAEFKFIKLLLSLGKMRGVEEQELADFIKQLANQRAALLSLPPLYEVAGPRRLQWFYDLVSTPESANFFEARVTSYEKIRDDSEWEDVYGR